METSNRVVLGIDCGTQSTKAVLYHLEQKAIVARASAAYELDPPQDPSNPIPGRAEQHPHKWIRALHICFRSLAPILEKHNYKLCGMGVSGQQHGMVPLDENLQVVRSAKLWCDVEAAKEAKEFTKQASEIMRHDYDYAGGVSWLSGGGGGREEFQWSTPPGFTAPKVLWMKKHEPELFAKVRWVILPHDYVTLCLRTGLGHDMNVRFTTVAKQEDNDDDDENNNNNGNCNVGDDDDDIIWNYVPSVSHMEDIISSIIPTTDLGDASGTGLLHPDKPEYVPELASLIHPDYINMLPKILEPNAVSGYLSNHWKDILFPGRKQRREQELEHETIQRGGREKEDKEKNEGGERSIPLSVGTGDNMASALGCKCIKTGSVVLSLGTSGTIFGVSESSIFAAAAAAASKAKAVGDETGTVSSSSSSLASVAPFRDATGRYLPLVCVMSCTGVLNSVLKNWCSSWRSSSGAGASSNDYLEGSLCPRMLLDHDEAIELARDIPAGCFGLTFLPFLGGERTPDWPHATGALLGLNPQNMAYMGGGGGIGLLYRCAMEGITFLIADALEQMQIQKSPKSEDNNDPTGAVIVVGGGSKNPLWRQMLADVLGVNLVFPTEPESAALGAAFQAGAVATGIGLEQFIDEHTVVPMEDVIVKPTTDTATLELYRDAHKRYREYSAKLYGSPS